MDVEGTTILSIRRKIVFIGNPSTGKTSLLNRICNDKFLPDYDSTIGVDFFTKTIYYNENIFKIQLWDSAGQEKYRSLIPSYLRGASIIFLVYDLTWRESFDAIKSWLGFVNQYTSKDQVKLVLVGNKSDLERKVKSEEGKKLAEKEGMLFFETSAKTADGIVDMFYTSFSMIDFFDSIRKANIDENLVKQLIEQNVVNKDKKEDKNKFRNDIVKNAINDDDVSKNDFLKKRSDKDKNGENKNNKDDNIIQIKIERNPDKNKKKKCNC
jgi:small GTP-binding protein